MRPKTYDIFLSYSHADRTTVESIANLLQQQKVNIWWDYWEMKPGDRLREKIISGIENADHYLVLLSENSISSSWVQLELDSAMIREIEEKNVRVIPAITGKLEFKDMPLDLRGKYSLSFKSQADFATSIEKLIDLIQPAYKRHRDLLARLRNPADKGTDTFQDLREQLFRGAGQEIQVAAIRGLEKVGGPDAIKTITERFFDFWGMNVLSNCVRTLGKLARQGGLLVLAATLLHDTRYYWEKAEALRKGAAKLGRKDVAETLRQIFAQTDSESKLEDNIAHHLALLERVPIDDVKYGATIARIVRPLPRFADHVPLPEGPDIIRAFEYAENRIPGLVPLLKDNGWTGIIFL